MKNNLIKGDFCTRLNIFLSNNNVSSPVAFRDDVIEFSQKTGKVNMDAHSVNK